MRCVLTCALCGAETGQITDTSKGWVAVYYRIQMLLALAVGVSLVLLPAVIVESPEPTFTAETLMRRVSGAEAGVLLATVNWIRWTLQNAIACAPLRSRCSTSALALLPLRCALHVVFLSDGSILSFEMTRSGCV